MQPISVVIITKNEERNIARAIDSVEGLADEIIVVDSFSTDRTKEICLAKKVTFIQTEWQGYAATKNYANSLASYSYIFSLDADEAVDALLAEEIRKIKEKGMSGVYKVNRLTNYCGKWIRHSGWYPDYKIRIFPKNGAYWVGDFVHEQLQILPHWPVHTLKGHLEHYSYYSFEEHRQRADYYSRLAARKMAAEGKKTFFLFPYFSAFFRFFSMFVLKAGFLDGYMGFKIALISAQSNILKYKELQQLRRKT